MGSVTVHRAQIGINANRKIEQRFSPSLQAISRSSLKEHTIDILCNFSTVHSFYFEYFILLCRKSCDTILINLSIYVSNK